MSPSSRQIKFTTWFHLGISKPSTSSSHLRLLYSSGWLPREKHRWRLTVACTTQETPGPGHPVDSYSRAPPPCPCTADPPRRTEVGAQWSQPILAADCLGKSLHLIYQQQPKLNYKRRVYSAHMKGTSQVPSLGDRGVCATGPYRIHTELGHLLH